MRTYHDCLKMRAEANKVQQQKSRHVHALGVLTSSSYVAGTKQSIRRFIVVLPESATGTPAVLRTTQ